MKYILTALFAITGYAFVALPYMALDNAGYELLGEAWIVVSYLGLIVGSYIYSYYPKSPKPSPKPTSFIETVLMISKGNSTTAASLMKEFDQHNGYQVLPDQMYKQMAEMIVKTKN